MYSNRRRLVSPMLERVVKVAFTGLCIIRHRLAYRIIFGNIILRGLLGKHVYQINADSFNYFLMFDYKVASHQDNRIK